MASKVELYGTNSCPFTAELREQLEWDGASFVEYDVETDAAAAQRLAALVEAPARVPVLVEDGRVTTVGWQGRTCMVDLSAVPAPQAPPAASADPEPSGSH
jgi:mycoredoxin